MLRVKSIDPKLPYLFSFFRKLFERQHQNRAPFRAPFLSGSFTVRPAHENIPLTHFIQLTLTPTRVHYRYRTHASNDSTLLVRGIYYSNMSELTADVHVHQNSLSGLNLQDNTMHHQCSGSGPFQSPVPRRAHLSQAHSFSPEGKKDVLRGSQSLLLPRASPRL